MAQINARSTTGKHSGMPDFLDCIIANMKRRKTTQGNHIVGHGTTSQVAGQELPISSRSPRASGLLTVPEAAQFLRISRNLAYDMIARGELPHIRLGRVIRVPHAALEEWLDASTVRGTPYADPIVASVRIIPAA